MVFPISKEQDFGKWSPEGYCTDRDGCPDEFYDMRDQMWGLNLDPPIILRAYQEPAVGKVVASLVVLKCMRDPKLREKLKKMVPEYAEHFGELKSFESYEGAEEVGEAGKKQTTGKRGETGKASRKEEAGESLQASFCGVFDDARFAMSHLAWMHVMETGLRKDVQLLSSTLSEAGSGKIGVRSNLKLGRSVGLHHAACEGYLPTTVFYDQVEGDKVVPVCSKFVGTRSLKSFMNEVESYARIANNPKVCKLVPNLLGAGVQVDLAKIDAFNKLFTGESPIEEYTKLFQNTRG